MRYDTERLKRLHPIAQVMAEHGVVLRRSGARLVGRCPFHRDNHPSLVVYPETQSFYCFGCRTGGDVITFLQRTRRLSFREAAERLDRASVGADASRSASSGERRSLDDRAVLTAACNVYHESLLRSPDAQRYLADRGIGMPVSRQCRLGYSDGTTLRPCLERRRLGLRRATELGLLWPSGGETLTGRIIVPELRAGQCIWMLGRAIDDGRQPKYWGISRPKPILGYERVQGRSRVVVTEGAFDYLTGVGWGLSVCALLGTHARAEQLTFLDRDCRVDLVFDTDEPGRAAAQELAARLGERAHVVALPDDVKDLNDLGQRLDGRSTFLELLSDVEGHARRREEDARDVAPAS